MKRKMMIIIGSILCLAAIAAIAGTIFLNSPGFGRLPQGERLERIKRSPNYSNGQVHNLEVSPMTTTKQSRLETMWRFLTDKPKGIVPDQPIKAIKTDLKTLPPDSDLMVWFGHSSYLLQLSGRKFLIDPVFHKAAPVSFVNKPFPGTDLYKPSDMPDHIDYLVITHDHWDHLDYETVKELHGRVGKVICPLGVGEHFEYWGYDKSELVELDWQESTALETGFDVHCLPTRHLSGRGLAANRSLWASFMLDTPSLTVFVGGDGGYGSHFKEIGTRFPHIDVAILENGQYNNDWRYIHTMPHELAKVVQDLAPRRVITVHHSKYALARHPWDEPLKNEQEAAHSGSGFNLTVLQIGEVAKL